MQQAIDAAAETGGRDPKAVQRIYNVMGTITDQRHEDEATIVGPPEHWIDTLLGYREALRFDSFLFWPVGADPVAQATLFTEQVAPFVRLDP